MFGIRQAAACVMIIMGIVGGVASGKSLVGQQLQELGAARIDADKIGHEVLREPEIKSAVRDQWGSTVFVNEEIDRRALGKSVFGPPPQGPAALARLEQLTHPLIGERIRRRIEELRQTATPAVILDAPVMVKAGWIENCDVVLFVDTQRQQRLQRARQRGWSDEEFAAREAAQEDLQVKRDRADVLIDNNGSVQATRTQVSQIWDEWVSPGPIKPTGASSNHN